MQIDSDIQAQGAAFMMTCMFFTCAMMQQQQQQRDTRHTGVRGLPKGMRHHAISNGLVAAPPKCSSKTQRQLDRTIDALGLRK